MKKYFVPLLLIGFIFFNACKTTLPQTPTVFIVGDSTVKNGSGQGLDGLWGWGDFIVQFFDSTKVSVENHALGGTSSRTYIDKGLWNNILKKIRPGDYVFIQFGHNDNGPINDTIRARGTIHGIGEETEEIYNLLTHKHEVVHSYGWYLEKIINETKRKKATPVVLSPIPRNKWESQKVPRNNKTYGLWAKQIAERNDVPFIDLNEGLANEMEAIGESEVTGIYFYEHDHTHTTAQGALLAASVVVEGLQNLDLKLSSFLLEKPALTFPKKKTIFLIGDSTMANSSNQNAIGWGVPFPKFIDSTKYHIKNLARGGRSSRTFIYEGLWEKAKNQFKEGDLVLIQFGHNDAGNIDAKKYRGSLPGIGDETCEVDRDSIIEVVHTFGWFLNRMIRETKDTGAIPVVLSLTPRNEWPEGVVEQRTDTYVKWSKEVTKNANVPFLDVSDIVANQYQILGKEKVATFFPQDHTHTNIEGATFVAKIVADMLKQSAEIKLY